MDAWLAHLDEPYEGAPFPLLAGALPDGAVMWAGNSMPVRDLDAWLPSTGRALTVRASRGASGIDGVVSTALGSAAVAGGPVALVVGDLSFLHDLNALVAARLHGLSATIVLVNNDGGGIFSFLPQASAAIPRRPAGALRGAVRDAPRIDVGPIVAALGGEHRPVGPATSRRRSRDRSGGRACGCWSHGTDRARNVELHRDLAATVAAALAPLAGTPAPAAAHG
jgi:2-succinyl-5-enolpyruvyl-6-hydroxy-3-cyclohexene-1-carboxylate synthase